MGILQHPALTRNEHLWMDPVYNPTELFGGENNTLLKVPDNTVSAMGALLPETLDDYAAGQHCKINERLQAVEFLLKAKTDSE